MNVNIDELIAVRASEAPRITPQDVEDNIVSELYFTAAQGYMAVCIDRVNANGGVIDAESAKPAPKSLELLTFCVLVLQNGFTVTGESACASPENFDAEIGQRIARQNAVAKIWPLMGYELRTELAELEGL